MNLPFIRRPEYAPEKNLIASAQVPSSYKCFNIACEMSKHLFETKQTNDYVRSFASKVATTARTIFLLAPGTTLAPACIDASSREAKYATRYGREKGNYCRHLRTYLAGHF
jgi:hypothetical protein